MPSCILQMHIHMPWTCKCVRPMHLRLQNYLCSFTDFINARMCQNGWFSRWTMKLLPFLFEVEVQGVLNVSMEAANFTCQCLDVHRNVGGGGGNALSHGNGRRHPRKMWPSFFTWDCLLLYVKSVSRDHQKETQQPRNELRSLPSTDRLNESRDGPTELNQRNDVTLSFSFVCCSAKLSIEIKRSRKLYSPLYHGNILVWHTKYSVVYLTYSL